MNESTTHIEHKIFDFMQSMTPIKIEKPGTRKKTDMALASAIMSIVDLLGSRSESVDKKIAVYNSLINFNTTLQRKFSEIERKTR